MRTLYTAHFRIRPILGAITGLAFNAVKRFATTDN